MEPNVGVVILHWNSPGDAIECLESILSSDYGPLTLFVVDNGSASTEGERLGEGLAQFPAVRGIFLPENRGFAGGQNEGLRQSIASGCDFTLLLNQDVRLERETISQLVDNALSRPDAGLLCPKLYLGTEGNRIDAAGTRVVRWLAQPYLRRRNRPDADDRRDPEPVPYADGAALLVSTRMVEEVGYLNEEYFMYFEDWDWAERARKKGFESLYVPRARARHLDRKGPWENDRVCFFHARNRLLFARKHLAAPVFWTVFLPHFLAVRMPRDACRLLMGGRHRELRGLCRGVLWHLAGATLQEPRV